MQSTFSQSFKNGVLLILIGLLVLAMTASFGPQLDGCVQGGQAVALRVYGESQSQRDFSAIYRVTDFERQSVEQQRSMELRKIVADGLVDRALLEREARALGFHVSTDQVMREFVNTGLVRFSMGPTAPPNFPYGSGGIGGGRELRMRTTDEDGSIDETIITRTIRWLGLTPGEFAEWQVREALAQRMRQTVVESAAVSPAEVWSAFVREKEQASVAYFRFAPRYFESQFRMTDEGLTAWMAEHTEEVDREYDNNRSRYTGLPEQVRARHILVEVPSGASDADRAAARAEANALLRRVRGGEDFEAVAREHSDDEGSARRGGDLGWNPRGRMVAPFDEAQFALEINAISDIVESQFGFHIIKVIGHREGDVPEAEAKRELAERLYREARASELAREAAERALTELRGGLTPEQLDRTLQGLPAEPPTDEEGNPVDEEAPEREALAPSLQQANDFGQAGNPFRGMDGGPLVRAVFEMDDDTTLPEEPVQLGTEFVVFQVTDRQHATRDDFTEEEQTRIRTGLLRAKQREVLTQYVAELRAQADRDQAVFINESILLYGDEAEREEADSDEPSAEGDDAPEGEGSEASAEGESDSE